jgi:acyl dehydratase
MALPIDKLGTTTAAHTATVDPDRAKRYAAATNDDNPAYLSGACAPPVFAVVPTWPALLEANAAMIPPAAMAHVVHGEQDMWFHQPLVPGMVLTTTATLHSVRVGSSGTRFTALLKAVDASGAPVCDIYNTAFVRGMTDGTGGGPDKPDHTFPEEARSRPAGRYTVHMDADQTFRYAEASGDTMPIHLDEAAARAAGLPGIIVHGLCTMAACSQAVIRTVCGSDPTRLRRLAVRFSRNVFPDSDVVVSLYDAGPVGDGRHAWAFEAHSRGELVVSHGRAETA